MLEYLFLQLPIAVSFQVSNHELKMFVLEFDKIEELPDDLVSFFQHLVDQRSKVYHALVIRLEDQFQKEEVFEHFQ
jgi:hypothetical protein